MSDLNGAIQEFLNSRQARGIKPGTIRGERTVLRGLMSTTGNLLVKNLDARHMDMYFTAQSHLAPGTVNRNVGYLQGFFKWCRARKIVPKDFDPLEGVRKRPVPPRDFVFLRVEEFTTLLDKAKNSRDRAVMALGLYTLQRISTVTHFTWGDVYDTSHNSKDWHIQSYSPKIEAKDALPLCLELKSELDKWRLEYGRIMGEVPRPNWRIVPAFQRGRYTNDAATGHLVRVDDPKLNPTAPLRKAEEVIQFALERMGYPTLHEGAHTLRRSGGKALYEELAWEKGHDGAIRIVQSMFGHKSLQTTEHYLRLTLERKRRNDLLAGTQMFPAREATVTELGVANG
jgi:integrase